MIDLQKLPFCERGFVLTHFIFSADPIPPVLLQPHLVLQEVGELQQQHDEQDHFNMLLMCLRVRNADWTWQVFWKMFLQFDVCLRAIIPTNEIYLQNVL